MTYQPFHKELPEKQPCLHCAFTEMVQDKCEHEFCNCCGICKKCGLSKKLWEKFKPIDKKRR